MLRTGRTLPAFWKSLRVQGRVVWALALREVLTRYGRHNIGFFWLFVEPMIFTLGITTFWTVTKNIHGSNLPIVPFAVTGYSTVLLWRNMPSRLILSLQFNVGLMHHRNVRPLDVYFARLLLESSGVTMSFTALTLFFTFMGWMDLPEDPLKVVTGWLMLNWFGWALGLTLGSISERTEVIEKLWHPATYFLFPLGGAAFIVDALPKIGQDIVLYLPMVHCVELIRDGFFGSAFRAHYDMTYVTVVSSLLTLLGLANTRYVSQRISLE